MKNFNSTAEVYGVPKDNVALTSYLFVTANIFRLYMNQQAAEISELKRQLKVKS